MIKRDQTANPKFDRSNGNYEIRTDSDAVQQTASYCGWPSGEISTADVNDEIRPAASCLVFSRMYNGNLRKKRPLNGSAAALRGAQTRNFRWRRPIFTLPIFARFPGSLRVQRKLSGRSRGRPHASSAQTPKGTVTGKSPVPDRQSWRVN